jgi:hypothetical protein
MVPNATPTRAAAADSEPRRIVIKEWKSRAVTRASTSLPMVTENRAARPRSSANPAAEACNKSSQTNRIEKES